MTTKDRNEELVRELLERRASEPPPWLADETIRAVHRVGQRGTRRARGAARTGVLATAAIAVAILAVAAGIGVGSGILRTTIATAPINSLDSLDIGHVASSPTASEVAEAPSTTLPPEPTASLAGALPADSIAVVTTAGDGLRVRSAPGIDGASEKLSPLLPRATRMLVLDGPVAADGYGWYQVYAPAEKLAGWVAAGDDGIAWIRPGKSRCPDPEDGSAMYGATSIDLLLCFKGNQVEVVVAGSRDREATSCGPWSDRIGCQWTPEWFAEQRSIYLDPGPTAPGDTGAIYDFPVVLGQDVSARDFESASSVVLSFDHPDAQSCRVRDDGSDSMERWQAVLACRLLPVVEEVTPDAPIDVEGP